MIPAPTELASVERMILHYEPTLQHVSRPARYFFPARRRPAASGEERVILGNAVSSH